jgi:hypothetical protein
MRHIAALVDWETQRQIFRARIVGSGIEAARNFVLTDQTYCNMNVNVLQAAHTIDFRALFSLGIIPTGTFGPDEFRI